MIATLTLFGALVATIRGVNPAFSLPDPVVAAAPLIPLAPICLLQIIGSQATVRSFYARALEREIRQIPNALQSNLDGYPGLEPFSYPIILVSIQKVALGE